MANPKDLAFELAKSVAEGKVEALEDQPPKGIGIMAVRKQYRCQAVAVFFRIPAQDFESPTTNRPPGRFRQTVVALENFLQPFVKKHPQRFTKAKQQIRCGSVGKNPAALAVSIGPQSQ